MTECDSGGPPRSALGRVADRVLIRLSRVTTSGGFIPEIDGLRFVAIGMVFLAHVNSYTAIKSGKTIGVTEPTSEAIVLLVQHGQWGVQLFFVISGLILSLPFAASHFRSAPSPSLSKYFLRRLTRLEPPYLLVMTGSLIVLVLFNSQGLRVGELLPGFLASCVYAHSMVYGEKSPIQFITWSLEVEIQFYIFAPLLARVFAIRRCNVRRSVLVGAMMAFIACQNALGFGDSPRLYLSVLNYAQYFLAGFLLADLYVVDWNGQPGRSGWWDLGSLVGWPLLFCVIGWVPPLSRDFAMPFLMLLLCIAIFRGVRVRALLTNRWITTIGGMCYSLYLLHVFLISAFGRFTLPLTESRHYGVQLVHHVALVSVPVLFVSALFFVLVERPCMRRDWPQALAHWMCGQSLQQCAVPAVTECATRLPVQ